MMRRSVLLCTVVVNGSYFNLFVVVDTLRRIVAEGCGSPIFSIFRPAANALLLIGSDTQPSPYLAHAPAGV
jgi:hypothetical protein